MSSARTVTNPAAGDDGTATWAGQVYADIGDLFDDKTLNVEDDDTTVTFDMNVSCIHTVTIAANRTFAVTNDDVGRAFLIRVVQGTGGSRTVTWWSGIKWPGGSAPLLSTTVGHIDAFLFLKTGAGAYDAYFAGFGLS